MYNNEKWTGEDENYNQREIYNAQNTFAQANQGEENNHNVPYVSESAFDQQNMSEQPWIPPVYQKRQRRGEKWKQENVLEQEHSISDIIPAQKDNRENTNERRRRPLLFLTILCVTLGIVVGALSVGQVLLSGYIQTQEGLKQAAHEQFLNRYPIQYRELIEQEAAKNNLQPAFVAAIILNESSFKKDAESSVGARGLMQVMESTAGWIAGKLDENDSFHFDLMYQAEPNIRYGAWYLGFLAERFNGDPVLVAGAYHAGQGEVSKWLANNEYSQDGETIHIENMIDGPTKKYVKKVTEAYAAYKGIYYTQIQEGNT